MAKIMFETGEILGKIQSIRFPTSGFFQKDLSLKGPLKQEDYLTFAKECLIHPTVKAKLGAHDISKIARLLDDNASLFPQGEENHLVHGDFDPANLLVDNINGQWSISAVLDWEFAFAGSPLTDMANMLRYAHQMPSLYQSAFLKGLRKGGVKVPDDWQRRIDLLNLLSLLDCLVRSLPDQRPRQCADILDLIRHILSKVAL
jgi:aminoglycoside phosphotransferase (APT) family kinase protein